MRAREFLNVFERTKRSNAPSFDNNATPGDPNSDPLYSLKSVIANKIKDLPATPETQNSLDEIDEILSHIKIGGRRKASSSDLSNWTDQDVVNAKDLLARYIVGLDAPVAEKRSMIEQWKSNGLIDVNLLLSGTHTIEQVVKGYSTNRAVKELADDLMQVTSLGKGKGEFFLKVLSPVITGPSGGKGDILVKGFGTVEVKTTDGGAGRFTDRQVKPGSGYQSKVTKFINDFSGYLSDDQPQSPDQPAAQPNTLNNNTQVQPTVKAKAKNATEPKPFKLAKTGISLSNLITLARKVPKEKIENFKYQLMSLLQEIFLESEDYVLPVIDAIMAGQEGKAKQIYGVGILNNYMAQKTDKGILYISLVTNPATFTFFTDNSSLNKAGFRLQISTVYPVTISPEYAYPQTSIVATSQTQPSI